MSLELDSNWHSSALHPPPKFSLQLSPHWSENSLVLHLEGSQCPPWIWPVARLSASYAEWQAVPRVA